MLRMLYNVARAELRLLFYSPVAWLLLVVFAIQAAMTFTGSIENIVLSQEMGRFSPGLTASIFSSMGGVFSNMQGYLYFYIPLLTMGLVSRELSSGSIKLLYSSPLTNFQIIIGKFLSVVVYGLLMVLVLFLLALAVCGFVEHFDMPLVLTGLLGLFLLICAYGAIGIFMSSLTSYQIVAALGTLIVLMLLSMVGSWGQEYDFVRDVTYWLSINGRSGTFIRGMICSEDLLYFLIVIALFLSLTIIRLNAIRQKIPFSVTLAKNIGVILLTCVLGYVTSLPTMKIYHDSTATKANTLTQSSQDIVAHLKDQDLTITTYINVMDVPYFATAHFLKPDEGRFEQYARFKPEIKLKYVYYYDTIPGGRLHRQYAGMSLREQMKEVCEVFKLDTNKFMRPEEIRSMIDLRGEGNVFVRQVVCGNGKKAWLRLYHDMERFPSEREISAAFKRVAMDLPIVGFVNDCGMRNNLGNRDIDYRTFSSEKFSRSALLNQGFDTEILSLAKPVPAHINILVLSDPREQLGEVELSNLDAYIARGGNLMLLGEPRRKETIDPLLARFGFEMIPGVIVCPDTLRMSPDIVGSLPTMGLSKISYFFERVEQFGEVVSSMSVGGLRQVSDKGFSVIGMFHSPAYGSWNEVETVDFVNEPVKLNPLVGEEERSYPTVLALTRNVNGKEQRIILSSDADCISNVGISGQRGFYSANFAFVTGAFHWFSYGEAPVDVRRPTPPDNYLALEATGAGVMKWTFTLVFPLLLVGGGVFTWLRRRSR